MRKKSKNRECFDCRHYRVICDGVRMFKLGARKHGRVIDTCNNKYCDPEPTKSPVQVEAFLSLHRTKRKMGMPPEQSFIEAICQTSDDVFRNIDKSIIEKYLMDNLEIGEI